MTLTNRTARLAAFLAAAVLALLTVLPAQAQRADRWNEPPPARNTAGQFDYYALVLSWSPTHCASVRSDDNDPQCNRRDGRRYAFVVHGLWPQHERGWPEYCPTPRRPFVPQGIIDGMLDIMPSPKLVIHEYRKHGVCSGLSPNEYYALTRRLFARIKIPEAYVNPFENRMVGVDELAEDFMAANPQLKPDQFAIACGGPGNRLREVRICFDRKGELRSCGRNEDQRRLCSAQRMFVPPVRATRTDPIRTDERGDSRQAPQSPLPMPRMVPGMGR